MKYLGLLAMVLANSLCTAQKSWSLPNVDSIYKGTLYKPFSVTTIDGKTITNESCKGKVTFISLWFEGCAGCRAEFGELNELYDSLKKDPACLFLAITYDDTESLKSFVKKYGLRYTVATNSDYDKFHEINYGMGSPAVIILDKHAKVAMMKMQALTRDENSSSGELTIHGIEAFIKSLE